MKTCLSFCCILLLFAQFLHSQELEITAQDDTIRPSLLVREVPDTTDTAQMKLVRSTYFNFRTNIGIDHNYQYRNVFTRENFNTVSLAASYYITKFQLNAKFIYLNSLSKGIPNFFRSKIQGAYYVSDIYDKSHDTRLQFSWNMENWPIIKKTDSTFDRKIIHEFALEYGLALLPIDLKLRKPFMTGGYFFALRPQVKTFIYGYGARVNVLESKTFLKNVLLGIGYYRQNMRGTDKGSVFKLELMTDLFSITNPIRVYGAYAVDYINKNKKNWEFGLLINVNLYRQLTDHYRTTDEELDR